MTAREVVVRVADLNVAGADEVLVTLGLGSCVAIVLHDPVARVGGLAHVLLPTRALARRAEQPGKFPQSAVPALLALMEARGADRRRVTARLVGGASMFQALAVAGSIPMGERNVIASRQAVAEAGIPLTAEDTGGDYGRTVRLDPGTGELVVLGTRLPPRTL